MADEITNALKRTTRIQLTKCVNTANELLNEESATIEDLQLAVDKLNIINDKLKQVTRQSLTDLPPDKLDDECIKMLEYEENAETVILKIGQRIKIIEAGNQDNQREETGSLHSEGMSIQRGQERMQRNAKDSSRELEFVTKMPHHCAVVGCSNNSMKD
ncbi:hypothetical protein RN001_001389 [Aquatica leii]|uniref:Uncharacterized protein n=1 Tax=Aquatica leii TaxID=1421715 RepID=A0AAN7SQW4_9COLE|nr:hypothetical protein RN001_001389 [Aquatica leii]